MRLPRLALSAAALALLVSACPETDPKKPGTWIAQLDRKDPKRVQNAARELRKMKAKEAVPALVALMRHEDYVVREEAAYALMEIGDAAVVQPLMEAVDLANPAANAGRANAKIAEALGSFGDRKAVPVLLRLLDARNDYARLAAVDALGHLGDPSSVPALVRLVEADATAPLLTKKAILALGDMQATSAVPALVQALVIERQGISFYVESSFALLQCGRPAAEALVRVLSGEDRQFVRWAEEHNRRAAGYLSKAAVILADFGWKDAIPALTKLLKWEDPDGDEMLQLLVQKHAAESLGRLRARTAAPGIAAGLKVEEANVRETYAYALAWIGESSALPALASAAQKGSWSARSAAITGLGLLGGAKQKAVLEGIAKKEQGDSAVKSCMDEVGAANEPEEMKKARCEQQRTSRPQFLKNELARLAAGEECGDGLDCWIGKLKDPVAEVRERAAYELGKLQDVRALEPLSAAAKDESRLVLRAVYIALDWFVPNAAAKDALSGKIEAFTRQVEADRTRAATVVVNEDLRRVLWKIRHLPWVAGAAAEDDSGTKEAISAGKAKAEPAVAPGKSGKKKKKHK